MLTDAQWLARHSEHPSERRSIQVSVESPHSVSPLCEGNREVGRERTLPHTPLSAGYDYHPAYVRQSSLQPVSLGRDLGNHILGGVAGYVAVPSNLTHQ